MRNIGLRASRGFWKDGKHVAKGELIIVPANVARELQAAGKGKMIVTRYPGLLDRGLVRHTSEESERLLEELEPGWYLKDEDCKPCPKKAAAAAKRTAATTKEAKTTTPKKKVKKT